MLGTTSKLAMLNGKSNRGVFFVGGNLAQIGLCQMIV
jgi:hypothetical protein